MLNFLKLKEMKKVFLFCVIAMAFASCAPKAAETTPAVDSTTVKVDSTVAVVDSAAVVDSTPFSSRHLPQFAPHSSLLFFQLSVRSTSILIQ